MAYGDKEPVIGEKTDTGGIANEWDIYYWRQRNGKDGGGNPYTTPGGVGAYNKQNMDKSSSYSSGIKGLAGNSTTIADKLKTFYGDSLDNLGQETSDYANRLKGNLDKNVANADIYNQQQGTARGLANARAGLSGVDTSAADEQSRRNASFGAAVINEDAKRSALDLYGKSVSNRIEGANKIVNTEEALKIAKQAPLTVNADSGGLFGSVICTELYVQGKLTRAEFQASNAYGATLSREMYAGYLTIARPIVKLMHKSDAFSNLFIGWAKCLAAHKPNKFTRIVMPIATVIGLIRLRLDHKMYSAMMVK